MVSRKIKIPRHGGPDGVGMNEKIFENLLQLLSSNEVTDNDVTKSIELCLSISKQEEWNNVYRLKLIEKMK